VPSNPRPSHPSCFDSFLDKSDNIFQKNPGFFPTFRGEVYHIVMDVILGNAANMANGLISLAKTGDTAAWKILYDQHRRSVYSLCVRMCGNKPDAEDALQESFISAFRKINQLRDESIFGGWLRRIAINHCIRQMRSHIEYTDLEDEQEPREEDDNWLPSIPFAKIQEAITSLPPKCRVVFVLFALEDYSHQEVADELGISTSTSKSQYHRAKQLLKTRLS
jgi:RNA polymerase sigma factor (sigma-70 family)